ncbi:MAG: hypothetical protein QOC93_2983 [Actinomycetota bacterium]|jgi:hypothetical protein|nr:hypothetical protein [Actinomycetota bacterium]
MTWHADPKDLLSYIAGRLTQVHASSVEAHLLRCGECRDVLAARTHEDPDALFAHQTNRQRLLDIIDEPRTSWLERLFVRAGVPRDVVQVVAAAPALRHAWWLAGTALLGAAALAAAIEPGSVATLIFLVAAPVVPPLGVAMAYGWRGEPADEITVVAPYPSLRLVILRTTVVLTSTLPVAATLSIALPLHGATALLWLLPALALCALTLALSTVVDPIWATTALVAVWLAGAGMKLRPPHGLPLEHVLREFVAFRPAGQAVLGGLTLLALVAVAMRRSSFETWGKPWAP